MGKKKYTVYIWNFYLTQSFFILLSHYIWYIFKMDSSLYKHKKIMKQQKYKM